MPIAADTILLGQRGEINAGEEIPATYLGTLGDEVKTDFKRLKSLGLIRDEARDQPAKTETPATVVAEDDEEAELPDGVKDLGSGWYEVDGQKVRGRDAAIAAAEKD